MPERFPLTWRAASMPHAMSGPRSCRKTLTGKVINPREGKTMRDPISWRGRHMDTEAHGRRTVYVRCVWAPSVGWMVDADTAFTVPAFIRVKGKRVRGFITPRDGMAFMQEHETPWFVAFRKERVDDASRDVP